MMTDRIELTPQFNLALKALSEEDGHLFITGKAGTGKSTLLQYYIEKHAQQAVVLAPTGIAALNVGGQTIHRFFHFRHDIDLQKINRTKMPAHQARVYRSLKEIIIDEISMVRADLLDCVDAFLRRYGPLRDWPFGGVRLIMFGDLYQLPPVVTRADREHIYNRYTVPYFFAAHALRGERIRIIELDKIFRQTEKNFIDLLNSIRVNRINNEQFSLLNSRCAPLQSAEQSHHTQIVITATNARAQKINTSYLEKINEPAHSAQAEIEGEFSISEYPTNQTLIFKRGARIIMLNNDQQQRWVNGSMATIIDVRKHKGGDQIVIANMSESGEEVEIERHRWSSIRYVLESNQYNAEEVGGFTQFPFRLAWAITVHKSQGKTFSRVHLDLGYRAFAAGQTYVALSRCRTLDNLSLQRTLRGDDIYVDQALVDFFAQVDDHGMLSIATQERKSAAEITAMLRDAIATQKPVRIEYTHLNGRVGYRTVIANQISEKRYQSKPYTALEAHCTEQKKRCLFRISNILDARILS